MQLSTINKRLVLSVLLLPWLFPVVVKAQIVAAPDGTGTKTQQQQDRVNISGGQLSGNGGNLFHSFSQFNVGQNQTANFISSPNIQNIIGRINGGDASIINGILQVTGGTSNLFLMNPAGIVFGANASLNLPGSFTATTATGINFGDGQFNAIGSNNYTNLVGNPTAFTFAVSQPGSIVNGGNLAVSSGQNIDLIGGTIVSTGTVSAPKGNVNIAAVPGQSLVRISQPGNVLGLEIPASAANSSLNPLSLPQLLTGNGIDGVTVAGNDVTLTRGNIAIKSGDVVVNNVNAGTATIAATNNLNLIGSNITTSDNLNLRAQKTVTARDTNSDPLNITAGKSLLIQGNEKVDIFALNNPNTNISAGGDLTLRSNTTVGGDAHFTAGGNFKIEQLDGKLGGLFSPHDPVIRASGDVSLANYTGASIHILAGGSVNIPGTITVTDLDSANGLTENVTLANGTNIAIDGKTAPTVDIRAGTTNFGTAGIVGVTTNDTLSTPTIGSTPTGSSITIGNINFTNPNVDGSFGNPVVLLTNQYAPNLNLAPGNINVTGTINTLITSTSVINSGPSLTAPSTSTSAISSGNITIVGRNNVNVAQLTTGITDSSFGGSINTGNITVQAVGNINSTGLITTENINAGTNTSGNISLNSTNGSITVDRVATKITRGNTSSKAGNINLNAAGSIVTKDLDASSTLAISSGSGGGNINVVAKNDLTTANILSTSSQSTSGNVTLNSGNDTQVGYINTSGVTGGNVDVTTTRFFRATDTQTFNLSPPQTSTSNPNLVPTSIYSNGSAASGGITIRHGGNGIIEFVVGNATTNGTKGALVGSNSNILNPSQSFRFNYTQGNIQIITGNTPIDPPPPTDPPKDRPKDPSNPPPTSNPDPSITNSFGKLPQFNNNVDLKKTQIILNNIEKNTGVKPAIIYAVFSPPNLDIDISRDPNNISELARDNFQLELVMVTPSGAAIRKTVPVTRQKLLELAQKFRDEVRNVREPELFKPTAQQLHKWLIEPLEPELKTQKIENLVFIMDAGLRSLPLAALHNGNQFLVQRYSVGFMPSLSLTDTRYQDIRNSQVLAMGAEITPNQDPLPAVPIELSTISDKIWTGKSFKDEGFTVNNLIAERKAKPFGILHLATHADFKAGAIQNSYIQFVNERLQFDRLSQLNLNDPPLELLVLSACKTALGDENAELGFAGFANRVGSKSAMGSLWAVSDEGTLGLMTSFYRDLKTAPIKSEALRTAQVEMLRGNVRLKGGKLVTSTDRVTLPPSLVKLGDVNLIHPYYWAGFTIVGNPW
jgi:filamentous hemagglutinin family protein